MQQTSDTSNLFCVTRHIRLALDCGTYVNNEDLDQLSQLRALPVCNYKISSKFD